MIGWTATLLAPVDHPLHDLAARQARASTSRASILKRGGVGGAPDERQARGRVQMTWLRWPGKRVGDPTSDTPLAPRCSCLGSCTFQFGPARRNKFGCRRPLNHHRRKGSIGVCGGERGGRGECWVACRAASGLLVQDQDQLFYLQALKPPAKGSSSKRSRAFSIS